MKTKICPCPTCPAKQAPQPIENFCRNKARYDGVASYCRACASELHRIRMQSPVAKELGNEASKRYRNSEKGKATMAAYYSNPENREKVKDNIKKRRMLPEGKLKFALNRAMYKTRNLLKCRARTAVGNAVLAGKIVPPNCCEWCGGPPTETSRLTAHHWRGYDPVHWLDVKYVHTLCHPKCEKVKPEDWP